MNHKYILLLLACTAGAAQAQRVNNPQKPYWARPERAANAHHTARPVGSEARAAGDILFSEDFANGLAGNNGIGAWTVDGPDSQWWVYSHTGPNGAYSNNTEIIESETVDNGFMIFQADSGNTDWSADPPEIVASPTNWDAGLVSPTMSLATPYVRVEFQQAFRYCCNDAPQYLQVSMDGGGSWDASYPVVTAAVNVDPGTQTTSINIANALVGGDISQVRLRFYHDGPNSSSSHYHWQIDDVKIIELNTYDLGMLSGSTSSWDLNTAFSYDSLNYTVYPFSQLHPIPLNVLVENNGSQDQTGAIVNFTVTEQGGAVALNQDQTVDIGGGLTQRVFVDPDFTPPATAGTYDVDFSITSTISDTTDGNDSAEDQFKVSEFIYSRDGGTAADYEDIGSGEYELCNGFHITNEVELWAVDVAIRNGGSPSPVGIPIVGVLKDGSDVEIELAETMEHTIASNELNGTNGTKVISMIFSEPQFLEAGLDYFVCIKHFGGAEVRTAINGVAEPQTTFIYYEQDPDVGPEWFYTTDMPMVRMNFNPSVGIADGDRQNGIGLGQNLPNPVNGTTLIPFDLQEAANLVLEVHDMSGKIVATQTIGKRGAGSHRVQFDASQLNEGVYFYSLIADDTRLTKRMTVIH